MGLLTTVPTYGACAAANNVRPRDGDITGEAAIRALACEQGGILGINFRVGVTVPEETRDEFFTNDWCRASGVDNCDHYDAHGTYEANPRTKAWDGFHSQ